jgi:hypothetical protein
MDWTRQIISFVGALLILIAYVGHQVGVWTIISIWALLRPRPV